MNKDNAKDYLPLVQAMADGKSIQFNSGTSCHPQWINVDRFYESNPADCYRIKPDPREFWLNRVDGYDNQRLFHTKESARDCAVPGAVQVLFREVIE